MVVILAQAGVRFPACSGFSLRGNDRGCGGWHGCRRAIDIPAVIRYVTTIRIIDFIFQPACHTRRLEPLNREPVNLSRCVKSIFAVLFGLLVSVPSFSETSNAPALRMTGIFSPKRTVLLQAGELNRLLRTTEVLPSNPFSVLCRMNDVVEITFPDGSIVRQGPNTLAEYVPAANEVAVMGGSALVRFSKEAVMRLNVPHLEGKDALVVLTHYKEGVKAIVIYGKVMFEGTLAQDGEMFFDSGQPKLQGPFLIDLKEFISSSSLTIEFPNNRWVTAATEGPIRRQEWKKKLGLVAPAGTMLEGGSSEVKPMPAPAAPPDENRPNE